MKPSVRALFAKLALFLIQIQLLLHWSAVSIIQAQRPTTIHEAVVNGRRLKYVRQPWLSWFRAFTWCCKDGGVLADYRDASDHDAKNTFMDNSEYPNQNRQFGGWIGGQVIRHPLTRESKWVSNYTGSKPADFYMPRPDFIDNGSCTIQCVQHTGKGVPVRVKGIRLCLDYCHKPKPFLCQYT